jgi:uncharacterized protein (TIGR02217 family)
MSNEVFPVLAGLAWGVIKQPEYKTKIQKAVSGRELRLSYMTYPMYRFKMTYNVLRDDKSTFDPSAPRDELKTLLRFFLARRGNFDSFLYTDPSDNTVVDQPFGTGDGGTTEFQLIRSYGVVGNGFAEPVENIDMTKPFAVYVNGLEDETVTVENGLVTFLTPPDLNDQLTWSGSYYYRVRFDMDAAEFNQFMYDLWELKKCELYGSLQNKI